MIKAVIKVSANSTVRTLAVVADISRHARARVRRDTVVASATVQARLVHTVVDVD